MTSRYPTACPKDAASIPAVAVAFRCRRNAIEARVLCLVSARYRGPRWSKYSEPSTEACLIVISQFWHVKPQKRLLYCLTRKLSCFAGLRVLEYLCHCDEHYNRLVTYTNTLQTFQSRSRKSRLSCRFTNFVQIL